MLNRTPLFAHTDFYKNLRSDVVKRFKEKLKRGRIAVNKNLTKTKRRIKG